MTDVREGPVKPRLGMTGIELATWRSERPGKYRWKNKQWRLGWSQARAAKWFGVSLRQWQRYESGETPIPRVLVNRMRAHEASLSTVIDKIFEGEA